MSRFLKLNPFQKIFVEAKVQKLICHEMSKVSLRQVRADSSEVVFIEHYIDLTSWTPTTHNTLFAISLFSMMIRLVVALVKQGSALLARGWVTACLISRRHLSGLVAVASNACEVTLWIDFHGRGLNET